MSSYEVYVCDVCGSKSEPTQNQFNAEGWYYGLIDTIHISLPFLNGIKGESKQFCSANCAKQFLGSFFMAAKAQCDTQCDKYINNNKTDY